MSSSCEGVITYRIAPPPAPPESTAGFNLGLPVEALGDMVAAGYLERPTSIETRLVASYVCYSATKLNELFGSYLEDAAVFG